MPYFRSNITLEKITLHYDWKECSLHVTQVQSYHTGTNMKHQTECKLQKRWPEVGMKTLKDNLWSSKISWGGRRSPSEDSWR